MQGSFSSARQQAIAFARDKLREKPVYLDTETTGLERSSEIVEISVVDDDNQVLFSSLVRPSQPIPAAATHIHGITDSMVQDARPWPVIWSLARSFLIGRPVIIYNAEYDLRLMQQSHMRYRLPWRENLNSICAMQLYAQFRGEWDSYRRSYRIFKLEDAGRASRISLPNAHRADADALLTRALFHYIAEQE